MDAWILERYGEITCLTLNRPPVNALDRRSLDELASVIEEIEADRGVRVLIITGGIEGIFCSGGDLKYWRQIPDGREVSRAGRQVFAGIERLPQPTLAAINGHVVGDGLALALSCDFRIVSETASFRLPEVGYGFIPGWGLIQRLVTLVGRAHASELLLSGRKLEPTEARMIGLINEVVAPERLQDRVLRLASQLSARSPAALSAAKCALRGGDEKACFTAVWGAADCQEGIDALLNKRTAVFKANAAGWENSPCCQSKPDDS
jgi:enoyl-CoA hydratase/carnithine racemase